MEIQAQGPEGEQEEGVPLNAVSKCVKFYCTVMTFCQSSVTRTLCTHHEHGSRFNSLGGSMVCAKVHYTDTGYVTTNGHHQRTNSQQFYNKFATSHDRNVRAKHLDMSRC